MNENEEATNKRSLVGAESASKKIRSSSSSSTLITVSCLPPQVYRLADTTEAECAFLNADEAGQVIADMEYDMPNQDGTMKHSAADEFKQFRDRVVTLYHQHYPLRDFSNDPMFVHTHRNSPKVVHLINLCSLRSHISKHEKTIRVTMGAPQHEEASNEGYPTDSSGYNLPPVKAADIKSAVAQAEHDLEAKANEGLRTLYFNEKSPLHYAFNSAHAPIIKSFLKQKASTKVLDGLCGAKAVFHGEDVNDYMQKSAWTGGWANSELLHQTHSIPEKGRFPPDPSAKGPPKIPLIDFSKSQAVGAVNSGVGPAVSGSVSTGDGLALVAAALNPQSSSNSGQHLKLDSTNILKYQTWEKFLTAANLSAIDLGVLKDDRWDDLDVLKTTVDLVLDSKPANFLDALKEQLPSSLSTNGCIRLIAAMKKNPTLVIT